MKRQLDGKRGICKRVLLSCTASLVFQSSITWMAGNECRQGRVVFCCFGWLVGFVFLIMGHLNYVFTASWLWAIQIYGDLWEKTACPFSYFSQTLSAMPSNRFCKLSDQPWSASLIWCHFSERVLYHNGPRRGWNEINHLEVWRKTISFWKIHWVRLCRPTAVVVLIRISKEWSCHKIWFLGGGGFS